MNALTKRLMAYGASAVVAVSGAYLVAPWEGKENVAYRDLVGVVTICYGQTKDVKMGDRKTDEECEKDLAKSLQVYHKDMMKHVKVEIPEHEQVAYTSFIWNLGESNWKSSTILKKLNASDHKGACEQLLRWNKAGGKVIKGLTNRRTDEYKTCMGDRADVNSALASLYEQGFDDVDIEVGEIQEVSEPVYQPTYDAKTESPKPTCTFKFLGVCWKR